MSIPLRMRAVSKRYHAGIPGCGGAVAALRGCSLDVHEGEQVGVLGRPGSGKSTLLLCAAGLLRPESGSIAWFGKPTPPHPHAVAFVPEHASHHRFLTVRETLEHAALRDAPRPPGGDRIASTLVGVGLERYADTRVARLSRGASVRLSIARALLPRPRLLLLDETLTSLTARERGEVEDVLLALEGPPLAVLVSSGEPRALTRLCSRVVRLEMGEIRGELTAAERGADTALALELEVDMSRRVESLLCDRVGGVPLGADRILVPLGDRSCEETLAHCRAMGVPVRSSRVVVRPVRSGPRPAAFGEASALTAPPGGA